MALQHVTVPPLQPERFKLIFGEEGYRDFGLAIERARDFLKDRVIWNVNSTARGGGVAEMLASLLSYARGADIDTRWVVISGRPDFFRVTKRIHNNLHGASGDGGPLGAEEQRIYQENLDSNAIELVPRISEGDIVILHDPQTAGLVSKVSATGAQVVWRCHVGLDTPNETARAAWDFLRPSIEPADAYVFSRKAFAWERLDDPKIHVIPPSIDAFSPKNQYLDETTVGAILTKTGLVQGGDGDPVFVRGDGSQDRVDRATEMYGAGPVAPDDRLVVQVSRWDALKDPLGVMEGYAEHVAPATDAHLVLAGPSVEAVSDDPEGAQVLADARSMWSTLPEDVRARTHLVCLPMDDLEENAAIVNALQRRANVIVQKSLAEGFGLTVAEGMWKARPVVASKIGGIQDQIEHGTSGLLIDDPHDLRRYGELVLDLLNDPAGAERIGDQAQARVKGNFLGPRHLMQYLDLFEQLS
ncbi:MAG: glycosyltransferase [Actinomycetota bacterium]